MGISDFFVSWGSDVEIMTISIFKWESTGFSSISPFENLRFFIIFLSSISAILFSFSGSINISSIIPSLLMKISIFTVFVSFFMIDFNGDRSTS